MIDARDASTCREARRLFESAQAWGDELPPSRDDVRKAAAELPEARIARTKWADDSACRCHRGLHR